MMKKGNILTIAFILAITVFCNFKIETPVKQSVDVTEGIKIIKKLEKVKASEIDKKISELEESKIVTEEYESNVFYGEREENILDNNIEINKQPQDKNNQEEINNPLEKENNQEEINNQPEKENNQEEINNPLEKENNQEEINNQPEKENNQEEINNQPEKENDQEKTNNNQIVSSDKTLKERYKDCIVMGDSQANALPEYDIINSSSSISGNGNYLENIDADIDKVIKLNPKMIIMCYGLNDIGYYNGDEDRYTNNYKKVITKIQDAIPDVNIKICSILQVEKKALEEQPHLKDVSKFNEALKTMCDELSIQYIDDTDLLSGQMYKNDGIHRLKDFYIQWAEFIANQAGL